MLQTSNCEPDDHADTVTYGSSMDADTNASVTQPINYLFVKVGKTQKREKIIMSSLFIKKTHLFVSVKVQVVLS